MASVGSSLAAGTYRHHLPSVATLFSFVVCIGFGGVLVIASTMKLWGGGQTTHNPLVAALGRNGVLLNRYL